MKDEYDVPPGRLLDQAVEELTVKLIGQNEVGKIKRAMRDPVKKENARATRHRKTTISVGPKSKKKKRDV